MASRYPITPTVDYCYHPIHIVDDDKDIIVPCNKCDGCLLHKANEWSMRCGMEIEDTPATIFGSLTYSNKYLPKLFPVYSSPYLVSVGDVVKGKPVSFPCDLQMKYDSLWVSDHRMNIRFNGVRDVLREDHIVINSNEDRYMPLRVTNWNNRKYPCINYASKRDIQLWLKLLRKDLFDYGQFEQDGVKGYFRYFVISEVGPDTHRNHFHFLLFCRSKEIASYLLEGSLYKNWKMCDEDRFTPYAHLCDSGARGYVTQYLTCFSDLPKVYREVKEVRPFRLASKSPAIGFVGQDKEKIYKDVERGVIMYSRKVIRLESLALLEYPTAFLSALFPKCHGFNKIPDSRRFVVYNYLHGAVRKYGHDYTVLSKRLSQSLYAQDYLATSRCYRFCKEYVDSPMYYYYLLDMYYYKKDMLHLRSFYESQQECDFLNNRFKIFEYYPNIEFFCCKDKPSYYELEAVRFAVSPFGYTLGGLIGNKAFFRSVRKRINDSNLNYRNEVKDIMSNMVKMAKFNERTNNAPTTDLI